MPEGDTLFRTARALHAALAGQTVERFESSLASVAGAARRLGLVGRQVEAVLARGKHLLVRFEGGALLHTHLGLHGSWRLEPAGHATRVSARVRAVIATPRALALCLSAPRVELLAPGARRATPGCATWVRICWRSSSISGWRCSGCGPSPVRSWAWRCSTSA